MILSEKSATFRDRARHALSMPGFFGSNAEARLWFRPFGRALKIMTSGMITPKRAPKPKCRRRDLLILRDNPASIGSVAALECDANHHGHSFDCSTGHINRKYRHRGIGRRNLGRGHATWVRHAQLPEVLSDPMAGQPLAFMLGRRRFRRVIGADRRQRHQRSQGDTQYHPTHDSPLPTQPLDPHSTKAHQSHAAMRATNVIEARRLN